MWIPRVADDHPRTRDLLIPVASARPRRRLARRLLAAFSCVLLLPVPPSALAQPTPPAGSPSGAEELIATIRSNRVERGEFTLLRQADGDFWVRSEDLPRLQLAPIAQAQRSARGEPYFSLRALGASGLAFNEADLTLELAFPGDRLAGSRIDLATAPAPALVTPPGTSLILSYRLAASRGSGQATQLNLDTDLNVRLGGILLRQAARLSHSDTQQGFARGVTQAIWDRRASAQRITAGDVLSTAGEFGTAITGAGLMVSKLYDMLPDLVRQPTATLRATTALPATVEVAVDGSPVYRGTVAPGPITIDNLLLYGGTRNVRLTVTDVSGHREVIDQPFLFTDSVLAPGLHDYNYFFGRRSELDRENRWQYKEMAWQAFHRYGATDALTVGAGGEGSPDFTTAGAGLTLRSDRLGLVSLDLLANRNRVAHTVASGWSARYSYLTPRGSVTLGHQHFGDGFRTFLTAERNPFLRSESRAAFSTQIGRATVGGDWIRSFDALGRRDTAALRLAANIGLQTTISAEVQATREPDGSRDWGVTVFLRTDLDRQRWVGSSLRANRGQQEFDLETGRNVVQGEGLGYRLGASGLRSQGDLAASTSASATWNLRPVTLGFQGTSLLRRGAANFAELSASGAVVGVDGYWGLTRQVNDSFALARLGVAQPGVEVLLNNQVQGVTDQRGMLFVPDVGAFGRQDVAVNDRQLAMQYNLAVQRRTIAPAYRSGTVVDFGGSRLRALAGYAWQVEGGRRTPIAARTWRMKGPAGTLDIETGTAGDFYLENAPPGDYSGTVQVGERTYACRLTVPDFAEAVMELKEGILCE